MAKLQITRLLNTVTPIRVKYWLPLVAVLIGVTFILPHQAAAVVNPQSSSEGVQGTINGPPPSQPATITTPTNGQAFNNEPVTVAGLCPKGLLVKVFANNVFVGSAECTNGSFSLQADLFSGTNQLVARVYDALDQAGPDSNVPVVQFASAQFSSFGTLLSLSSDYAKRGADPGQQLTWPININGGTGPYALSVDWGDGTQPSLLSEPFPGNVTLTHTYNTAGTYTITIKATDKNGEAGFLQLVGVANGPAGQSDTKNTSSQASNSSADVIWWPIAVMLPLLLIAFWLGGRHELVALRRRLEQSNDKLQ